MLDQWFMKFGSVAREDLARGVFEPYTSRNRNVVLFYDQEPLLKNFVDSLVIQLFQRKNSNHILANSEHSELKKQICKEHDFIDWYYFFHGFAALEWYRDYKYVPKIEKKFTKVFITLNHLVTKDRSHRLALVARLLENDLQSHGHISCQLQDAGGDWKSEVFDQGSKLSRESKKIIFKHFSKLDAPMVLDEVDHCRGIHSAKLNLPLQQSGFWHLVTETVFYHEKLHLTEKIFKPIVARRPFLLVAAPGNLSYLKSYGFKTFDRWINEDYDQEPDHDRRLDMIVEELKKLCQLPAEDLEAMFVDMQEVLDYNFDHFYGKFKNIIVQEMITNFEKCLELSNVGWGYAPNRQQDMKLWKPQEIYKRLTR